MLNDKPCMISGWFLWFFFCYLFGVFFSQIKILNALLLKENAFISQISTRKFKKINITPSEILHLTLQYCTRLYKKDKM